MLRQLRTRRRPRYGTHICALIAALLLLLSVSLLHSRLAFFNSHTPNHPHQHPLDSTLSYDPLLDDLDNDSLGSSNPNDDRIDEFDEANSENPDDILAEEEEDDSLQNQIPAIASPYYFFDQVSGVVRRVYNRRSIEEWEDYVPFNLKLASDLGFETDKSVPAFGSDDILVDEKLRKKLSEVRKVEDALLLKGSVLRDGWGQWFDKKGDFLRRDRMFKSNIEVFNPLNNPILQDPDGVGVTGLTRGDKVLQKAVSYEFKRTPFLIKKPLTISGSDLGRKGENGDIQAKRTERRTLNNDFISKPTSAEGLGKELYADGKRWGYYPGLDGRLSFGNFLETFFRTVKCKMRIFMVWNSPPWMFGARQQSAFESILYHHRHACVVVFSETIELNFFSEFVEQGYNVAVVMPNLDELLKDTPTHVFASVWQEWKKTKNYPTHYSELIRLAALYKYGGVYLDSDIIVLKSFSELSNTVGLENELPKKALNGAVMAFRKHSSYIMECLTEFYASYDDTLLRWNGADLLTRVANNFSSNKDIVDTKKELLLQPSFIFFPISESSILRYFRAPATNTQQLEQDALFKKILNESMTVHFWNSITSSLIPETGSLIFRLLNQFCIKCSDML
ncbi:hypothetical protein F511_20730 [Dorcoceras hygrometricum]|uniref:Alpha 1,4-glycosyltransferase domain-containing protein n=1 Tax=Dorcoceras hygrometricum TaxID=472368 RepID=A0A2Z7AY14_9LAMI|nr:hypothetical protein F511_20730 [Dorcoceras hygrometricum]